MTGPKTHEEWAEPDPFLDTPIGFLFAVVVGHSYCTIATIHDRADVANEAARAARARIVGLPIVADYRTPSPTADRER